MTGEARQERRGKKEGEGELANQSIFCLFYFRKTAQGREEARAL